MTSPNLKIPNFVTVNIFNGKKQVQMSLIRTLIGQIETRHTDLDAQKITILGTSSLLKITEARRIRIYLPGMQGTTDRRVRAAAGEIAKAIITNTNVLYRRRRPVLRQIMITLLPDCFLLLDGTIIEGNISMPTYLLCTQKIIPQAHRLL